MPANTANDAGDYLEECDHCNAELDNRHVAFAVIEHGGSVCEACRDTHYVWSEVQETYILARRRVLLNTCENVSRSYANDNCYESQENPGVWFLESFERDDYDEAKRPLRAVWAYHEKTPQDVHGGWPTETPRASLCFGVELEMEHSDDDSRDGQTALSDALGGRDGGGICDGRYILMGDGSLNPSGVELITQPYTLEYHQAKFGWKTLLGRVAKIGRSGRDTEACGMHVHVNRQALSALTLGKMLVFVNSQHCTRLIETIAQRDPEEWARRYTKRVRDGREENSDKYEAMHLSRRTVEFRIFRGNLRSDRVLKNIEFCHAVVSYCKEVSMLDLEKPMLFVAWLGKHKGIYPNLSKFLSEHAFTKRLNRAANAGTDARPSTIVTQSEEI